MFAVIYRSHIKLGLEDKYQKLWHEVASYFMQHRGAIGSCLHKTEDGTWIAYSRWPDKATRDASWSNDNNAINNLPDVIKEAIILMKNCIDESRKLPEICMEVVEDLLLAK